MKIVVSGASGLVGTALVNSLSAERQEIVRLMRSGSSSVTSSAKSVRWEPPSGSIDLPQLEDSDAIVHLAGASIAGGRWTPARKQLLRQSRVDATRHLVSNLTKLKTKPRVFVSASAIGYYGPRGDQILNEESAAGDDFLATLCRDWEAEARAAEREGIRTVILRFGVILAAQGGALKKMLTPFRFGLGGRFGDGRQWMSWVALDDVIALIRYAISAESLRGPVNAVAPNPVRNSEFTSVLAAVLRRPALFPAPRLALCVMLGEMADALLASQRVFPARMTQAGFSFGRPDVRSALESILT